MLELIRERLSALHEDEEGLTVVEVVLLIALIVLPIVLILILFGKDIKAFIANMWNNTKKEATELQSGGMTGSSGS